MSTPLTTNWDDVPIKHLCTLNPHQLPESTPDDFEFEYVDIGSVTREHGIVESTRYGFGEAPSRARRCIREGDALVSTVRTYLEAITRVEASHDGFVCSTGFAVLRPLLDRVEPRYLGYAVASRNFVQSVVANSVGVSYPAISPNELVRIPIPVPEMNIQVRIADFLDRESERVESLENILERTLALQRELDLAVLREQVGVGRWPQVQIRRLADLGTGHTPSRSHPEYWVEEDCVVPWFTLADVWQIRDDQRDVVADTVEKISEVGIEHSSAVKHPAGTVLLSRTASVGFAAVMGTEMAVSQDFMTWTCGPRLVSEFLLEALRATRPEILSLASGSTHKTIYMPDLHALTIPLPSVDQQRLAVKEIQSATARSRQLRRHLKSLKALSKEYLRSLITEAVTGQIDVVAVSESQMDERALATLQSATTSEGSVA